MVHYGPVEASHLPSPLCPKCGSPNTEVIGRLDDGRTLILRCDECGSHSTVITPDVDVAGFYSRELPETIVYHWPAP